MKINNTIFALLLSSSALAEVDHRSHAIEEIDAADERLAVVQFILDITTFRCGEPDEYAQTLEQEIESCEEGLGHIKIMREAIELVRPKLAQARTRLSVPGTDLCQIRRLLDQPRTASLPKSGRGWAYEINYKAILATRRGIEPRWALNLIASKSSAAWSRINDAQWHVVDAIFMEGQSCL